MSPPCANCYTVFIIYLGATLGAPLEEGQPPQMTGSAFVLRGHTEQEVREFLEKDVYTTSGVWNLAEASFIPVSLWFAPVNRETNDPKFRTAVRSSS